MLLEDKKTIHSKSIANKNPLKSKMESSINLWIQKAVCALVKNLTLKWKIKSSEKVSFIQKNVYFYVCYQ